MQIMTVKELAEFLRIEEQTIYRMVKLNKLPHFRIRRTIRFSKEAILEFINKAREVTNEKSVKV